jgi:SAM-dependent MidA family methyltransferase
VTLREIIEQEIRDRGPIPFSSYMERCLYHPELGYYSRNAEQFGKAGDFFTSSDVHAVFGRLMARQFEQMWRLLGSASQIEILELGPGRGLFAKDVLDWSAKKFPEFFRCLHYTLIERSPALLQKLQQTLVSYVESGAVSIPQKPKPNDRDSKSTTEAAIRTSSNNEEVGKGTTSVVPGEIEISRALAPEVPLIIFANEFFDALPVEIVSPKGQLQISLHDGKLTESWASVSAEQLEFLDRCSVHPESGERLEVALTAQSYARNAASTIQKGFLVVIDYGYTRDEQLAGRHRGTLKALRQHSVSANPYQAPGEQDITADVNFTALATAMEQSGITPQSLRTQSQFLMGIGQNNQFADVFEECQARQERAKVALQLKHLITPAGMGESFHVMVGSKGLDPTAVAKLGGLSFGR